MAETVLVTGGGGFVGKALCQKLIQLGYAVRSIARGEYPDLARIGVNNVRADLGSDPTQYEAAFRDVACVIHTASKVDMWGPYPEFFRANVVATRNIISLCKKYGIGRLVYTSSPSVIADGSNHRGADESLPYPSRYQAFYPATKAAAEREVLEQNSSDLKTIALRPHLIWGPGDRHLVPSVLEKARSGKLMIVGDGENIVDLCFIEECVDAHILAMHALTSKRVGGNAYFISQGEPTKLWEWVNRVLALYGETVVTRRISAKAAYAIATLLEGISRVMLANREPRLTKFMVAQMSTDHWFSIERATRDLGYRPKNSVSQCFEKLRQTIVNHQGHCSI